MKRWTTSALLLIRLDKEHGKSSSLPSLFWSKDLQNSNLPFQIQIENLEENEPGDPWSARFPFHSKTKSTSSKYLLYIFGLRLSFKGEKSLPSLSFNAMALEISHTLFLGEERMRDYREIRRSPLILPPSEDWHGNSLMNIWGKGTRGSSPPMYFTPIYTYTHLFDEHFVTSLG